MVIAGFAGISMLDHKGDSRDPYRVRRRFDELGRQDRLSVLVPHESPRHWALLFFATTIYYLKHLPCLDFQSPGCLEKLLD